MTNIYELFSTNEELEKQGIEIDYGSAGVFIIARAGGSNNKFAKNLEAKTRPYRRQIEAGTMDNDVGEKLLRESFVNSVLLGWRNVKDKEDNDIPYNRENALKLFEELPELFKDLQQQAMSFANFRTVELEEDAKN